MVNLLARYRLNVPSEDLHVLHRHGAAQLDRPRVVLSCAAPARGHALSVAVHRPELDDGAGTILSRGLLDPWQRLCVIRIHTEASVVRVADLPLALSVPPRCVVRTRTAPHTRTHTRSHAHTLTHAHARVPSRPSSMLSARRA